MNTKRILVFVLAVSFLAVNVFAGVEWVSTITTKASQKKANNEIISHVYAQKGNLKQEFKGVSNENMFYFQDGYWLYKSDSNLIYVVNDKKKSYMEMDLDTLLQLTGMFGQLVKIEVTNHSINTEVLPEETIEGFPCKHVKITSDYDMKVKIAFIKSSTSVHEVKEIWATPQIPGMDEINKSFLKKDLKTGIADLDEFIQKEMEQQKDLGFPIKMITTNIQKDKKGKVRGETTTTMTVTSLQSKTFPDSLFEVPAGYKREEGPTEGKKLKIF
jgi:hypothetical protein